MDLIHGEAIQVPVFEAPGQTAVGKFGWKDQDATILSFSGGASLNEMRVTNRLKPKDVTTVCKVTLVPIVGPSPNLSGFPTGVAHPIREGRGDGPENTKSGIFRALLGSLVVDV
jgi:hypothetical protein